MSDMVERVARALYECPGSDMLAKTDGFPVPPWERAHPAVRDDCRIQARAAIGEMREPTAAMCEAMRNELRCIDGNAGGESGPVPELDEDTERDGYRAAIDAALSEKS